MEIPSVHLRGYWEHLYVDGGLASNGKLQERKYHLMDRFLVPGDRETRMCCDDRVMNSRHHKWRIFLDQLSNFGYPKDSAGYMSLRHTNMAGMQRQEKRPDKMEENSL